MSSFRIPFAPAAKSGRTPPPPVRATLADAKWASEAASTKGAYDPPDAGDRGASELVVLQAEADRLRGIASVLADEGYGVHAQAGQIPRYAGEMAPIDNAFESSVSEVAGAIDDFNAALAAYQAAISV